MSDKPDKIDLHKLILDKIGQLGDEGAAAYFSRTPNMIRKWSSTNISPDVHAAQLIFDELMAKGVVQPPIPEQTPPPQGVTIPPPDIMDAPGKGRQTAITDEQPQEQKEATLEELVEKARPSSRFAFIMPTERDIAPLAFQSALSMWKKGVAKEIREHLPKMYIGWDSCIHRARNKLAVEFLESGAEWSIWMDADMVIPNGNDAWFKNYVATKVDKKWLRIDALQRLTSHNKTFVSAVYTERSFGGKLLCGPGMTPRGPEDIELCKRIKTEGPKEETIPVPYVGFGCVAVHRRVFEDILKTQPETQPEGKEPNFFTAFEDGPRGEDVAFCKRAIKAGHHPHLDLSVYAAHIGRFAFSVM